MGQASHTMVDVFVAEREIRIDAAPETVFDFFVDPDKMTLWKGVAAELDPRPGGIYKVEVVPGAVARGEYVRIDRPHSVVFTWGWEGDDQPVQPGTSTVEVTLKPDGTGTVLHLRHTGLPSHHMLEQHVDGWTHYLARLELAAAGRDPGRDANLDAEAPR